MKTLRVLLVDDEKLARRGLTIRLREFENIEIIGECQNGRQAIKSINELNPGLVFLDIQMPGINGFDVVKQLQSDNMPLIVFVTAFDHYAVDAFDIHALDYILKPIDEERLAQSINRAREYLANIQQHSQKSKLINMITHFSGKSPSSVLKMIDNGDVVDSYPTKIAIKDGETTTLVATK